MSGNVRNIKGPEILNLSYEVKLQTLTGGLEVVKDPTCVVQFSSQGASRKCLGCASAAPRVSKRRDVQSS